MQYDRFLSECPWWNKYVHPFGFSQHKLPKIRHIKIPYKLKDVKVPCLNVNTHIKNEADVITNVQNQSIWIQSPKYHVAIYTARTISI